MWDLLCFLGGMGLRVYRLLIAGKTDRGSVGTGHDRAQKKPRHVAEAFDICVVS